MKTNNFLIALALCIGLSSIQIGAMQPGTQSTVASQGYFAKMWDAMKRKVNSYAGYGTEKVSRVAGSLYQPVQSYVSGGYKMVAGIGLQNAIAGLTVAIVAAIALGLDKDSLIKIANSLYAGGTAVATGAAAMGRAGASFAAAHPAVAAGAGGLAAYVAAGQVSGYQYINLAKEAVRNYLTHNQQVVKLKLNQPTILDPIIELVGIKLAAYARNGDVYGQKGDNVELKDFTNVLEQKKDLMGTFIAECRNERSNLPADEVINGTLQSLAIIYPAPRQALIPSNVPQTPQVYQQPTSGYGQTGNFPTNQQPFGSGSEQSQFGTTSIYSQVPGQNPRVPQFQEFRQKLN